LLLTSLSEIQGMVIIDAMDESRHVIAIRARGIEYNVENRFNGFKTKNGWRKLFS
jgi:hypothetical protein